MSTNEAKNIENQAALADAGVEPETEAATEPEEARYPTAAEVTALFGVAMIDRLDPKKIHRLRKAFPGYASTLREVATTMRGEESDGETEPLRVRGIKAQDVEALHRQLVPLYRAEKALMAAYRAAYEQRLMMDDRIMEVMRKVQRAAEASEDPDLMVRWRFLGEFLKAFSGGRPAAKSAAQEEDA